MANTLTNVNVDCEYFLLWDNPNGDANDYLLIAKFDTERDAKQVCDVLNMSMCVGHVVMHAREFFPGHCPTCGMRA